MEDNEKESNDLIDLDIIEQNDERGDVSFEDQRNEKYQNVTYFLILKDVSITEFFEDYREKRNIQDSLILMLEMERLYYPFIIHINLYSFIFIYIENQ